MTKKFRNWLLATFFLATVSLTAAAQMAGKVYRIGILTLGFLNTTNTVAFRQGLRDLGYIEGQGG